MKAIKALVAFMTLLIVVGLGVLAWGLSRQADKVGAASPRPAAVSDGFGSVAVALPAGARIEQVMAAGDRVVLRVTGAGDDRFVVLDPQSGRVAGSFVLSFEPPQAPAR